MKKGTLITVAAVGTAAMVSSAYFKNMDMKKRCDMCSECFKKAIFSFSKNLPDAPASKKEALPGEFFSGNGEYLNSPAKNAVWQLGYASLSILPTDINTKKYCIAGNTRLPANYAKGVLDDIKVRTVVLDDSSSRGSAVFSAVDCIGLSNKNIRDIRARLYDFSKENNIAAINISSTHTHSSIDTMGIWGPIVEVFKNNKKVLKTGEGELVDSCDIVYIEFLKEQIIKSIKAAVEDMTPGKLYKAYMGKSSLAGVSRADSLSDRGLLGYVWDRRAPKDCSAQLLRLRFVPKDKAKNETVIVNFGAHPYINSMKIGNKGNGDMISGDFVYSLCEHIEKSGANALFINGAVAAVYPTRLYSDKLNLENQAKCVGRETARIALAMTKKDKQIQKDSLLSSEEYDKELLSLIGEPRQSVYSRWLRLKNDEVIKETELKPLLNLRISEVPLKVDNPIFYAIAKLRIGEYNMIPGSDGKYTSFTEVGYLELGGEVKSALIPGELEPSLLSGSYALRGEYTYSGEDYSSVSLREAACDDTLTVFGLTNDAIGYIIPDNDFSMMFLGTSKKMQQLFGNHYLEIFSFGKNTAASLTNAFKAMLESYIKE